MNIVSSLPYWFTVNKDVTDFPTDPAKAMEIVKDWLNGKGTGKICVTDPCYSRDVRCAAWDLHVIAGNWCGIINVSDEGSWGHRVASIVCYTKDSKPDDSDWEMTDFDIGVDSGQCGVFDASKFPETRGEYNDINSFYGECCAMTRGYGGVVGGYPGAGAFGIVSGSGYGDGGYSLEVVKNDEGLITAVRVTFIGEDDEEDFDDEYDNEN